LKSQGHSGLVTICAKPKLHARIIKAVGKEKLLDIVYKIEIYPQQAILASYRSPTNAQELSFTLRHTLFKDSRSSRGTNPVDKTGIT